MNLFSDWFSALGGWLWPVFGVAILASGFFGSPLWLWTLLALAILFAAGAAPWIFFPFAVLLICFNISPFRRVVLTRPILDLLRRRKVFPRMSQTEREALQAGDVWIEGELFSGKPRFARLRKEPYPDLSERERKFIQYQVGELCRRVQDWDVWKEKELPIAAWEYIKAERFFGMIIPEKYGGLGFSVLAHSSVIMKLASRSIPLSITVMVPNSLGPAKLLIEYGTEEQKAHYLPRLARGEDIPCFALTEPTAGSDAAAIEATGTLFRDTDGKLYLRLNWNKRWITLSTIATVIGLAFRLRDPENLMGRGEDVGITCALIPANTPGIVIDRRHDPLSVPFYNSPIHGTDVVVPADSVIGGIQRGGQGWEMLMASLADGRGISLPAQSTGGAKLVARVSSAHSVVRKQFGISIGRFEGIGESLAEIFGMTYLLEAARRFTCGALDQGLKPSIVTAIAKYQSTEIGRKIINHGMDISGGAGITRGPRNLLANGYIATPVSITVEGANILTRTLMIFGQGALRAHPYAFQEIEAYQKNDLARFDRVFWKHGGHVIRNVFRAALLSLSRGYLEPSVPRGTLARYYRKMAWASACFALMADFAMISYGGRLKVKESIDGRFADVLSWMYLGTAALRRFEAEGSRPEDLPLLRWCMEHAFSEIQAAFEGLFVNARGALFGGWVRRILRWSARLNPIGSPPADETKMQISVLAQKPGEQRERLLDGMYLPRERTEQLYRLEHAFRLTVSGETIERKIEKAVSEKKLKRKPEAELYRDAFQAGVISRLEFNRLRRGEHLRLDVIQVDDFSFEDYYMRPEARLPEMLRKKAV